jgi:hypothetical protein
VQNPPHPACTTRLSHSDFIALVSARAGPFVQVISTHKPRWLRDLVRFLPLRSQFVLSGNVRDLHIHEPAPAEVTAVPLATILVDQLKGSGYQRIVTFDPRSRVPIDCRSRRFRGAYIRFDLTCRSSARSKPISG